MTTYTADAGISHEPEDSLQIQSLDFLYDFSAGALFRLKVFFNLTNSIIFILFGKYCQIVDQLGSKDSSRDFQLNYVISYFFTYI